MLKKASLAAIVAVVVCSPSAWAQHKAEITPFVGYMFGGNIGTRFGDISIKDDVNYGVILDFNVRPGGQVELSYTRMDTQLQLREFSGIRTNLTDISVEYFQIGGLGYVQRGQAQPFGKFTLGVTRYNPKQNTITGPGDETINVSDEWRFSMVFGLGVKFFPSERVGLRLQGDLAATFLDTGGSVFCGFGGCSLGLFGTGIWQADIAGGVTIAVG